MRKAIVEVINANDILAKTEMMETYLMPKRKTRTKPKTIPESLGFFHRVRFSFISGVSHIFYSKSIPNKTRKESEKFKLESH